MQISSKRQSFGFVILGPSVRERKFVCKNRQSENAVSRSREHSRTDERINFKRARTMTSGSPHSRLNEYFPEEVTNSHSSCPRAIVMIQANFV